MTAEVSSLADSRPKAPREPGPPRIAVFCSANAELEADFLAAAEGFGRGLAERGWELIYGGAKAGLMGTFADAAIRAGGVVRGAITRGLAGQKEIAHENLRELVVCEDLFERKRWMNDRADAFVIFPGGFGTLDEALEVITWKALGDHAKPILFVNLNGFWNDQIRVFERMQERGVIRAGGLALYETRDHLDSLWTVLDAYFAVS